LRGLGHDAVHASQIGLATAPDTLVLERARSEDRVVVTADLDYPRLLAIHGSDSPGVILLRGLLKDDEAITALGRLLEELASTDLSKVIAVVEESRVRIRRLPVVSKSGDK
jgi:predicted nuclease of predicted toxin-antitoxin system